MILAPEIQPIVERLLAILKAPHASQVQINLQDDGIVVSVAVMSTHRRQKEVRLDQAGRRAYTDGTMRSNVS